MPTSDPAPHYRKPGWFTKHVFNQVIAGSTRLGLSVWGSRQLAVRGRRSGEWRTTPVNPLTLPEGRYLVAPRGETQWVKNLRVAGDGELRKGRHAETFTATELRWACSSTGSAPSPPTRTWPASRRSTRCSGSSRHPRRGRSQPITVGFGRSAELRRRV